MFGHVESPLDFVHRFQAAYSFQIANRKRRAALVHGIEVPLRGRVQRVQLQVMVAQRGGDFADYIGGLIVEVRPRAEDLHTLNAVPRDLRQQSRSQFALDEKVGG